MLPLGRAARVGDRLVEATVEPGQGELAQIGQHQREVGVIECGEQSKPGLTDPADKPHPHRVEDQPFVDASTTHVRCDRRRGCEYVLEALPVAPHNGIAWD